MPSLSRFIDFKIFLISLLLGLFAVYVTMPDMRKIYVYPTPDNVDVIQYKDETGTCFVPKQKEVKCPKDGELSKIPIQT
jgi:hypothetical protein|tara:strand:- start:932 stop:1168 length:237 start_codon:yes stop_codon:yes gene_type:complete